jgi:Cu/Ag efflux pump CusA
MTTTRADRRLRAQIVLVLRVHLAGCLSSFPLHRPGIVSDIPEIERPLAVVMIGGLVSSTLFTLLVLPTFYTLVHNVGERLTHASARWRGASARART